MPNQHYDGVIGVVRQKTDPIRFLLIKNKATGNITFPAWWREEWEYDSIVTLHRELQEETGLTPGDYHVHTTPLIHTFVYGPTKKERAGQLARQPVYLVETNKTDGEPKDSDSIIVGRFTVQEAYEQLSFADAKQLLLDIQDYLVI